MGKKLVMLPAKDVELSTVEYHRESIKAPKLSGFTLKLFVWLIELPIIGPWLLSFLKEKNKFTQMLQNTVIPETPMFRPEFPPQEPEPGVILMDEDGAPVVCAESALECLPPYDPNRHSGNGSPGSFLYWTIRDYAHAYRFRRVTPSMVAEHVISYVEESKNKMVPNPLLISFIAEDVRKQAMASTRRFEEGRPLSVLDGIFMVIKDDIDCFPHPTRGATTWFHEVRSVNEDAVCVSRLRSCGVIFVGKASLHELGLGTTGNNSNYGTVRNPHSIERYTGGSSSGPAGIVSSGLCPAVLGTDGGGSNRIASSLCGVVGTKTTYGRADMSGALYDCGTVEVIAPIASTVEDAMLVYAAMSGSSLEDRICMKPLPPSLPCLSSSDSSNIVGSLRFGKYREWFNDVYSTDISDKCEDVLHLLSKTYGCQIAEIVLPELQEMRNAHLVSMGSEQMSCLNPHCIDGGYMSPEYAMDGHFSVKSDAFSFGVILLEITTGKRRNYYCDSLQQVWEKWKEGGAMEVVDSSMIDISSFESEVLRCIQIGLLCVQEKAKDRPNMSSVLMLGNEAVMLSPTQPAFYFGQGNCSDHPIVSCSINELTLTKMEAGE